MDFSKMKSYLTILIFSVLFLAIGNRIAVRDSAAIPYDDEFSMIFVNAQVTEIIEHTVEDVGQGFSRTVIFFYARITRGVHRGEVVRAEQSFSDHILMQELEVGLNDRVLLFYDDFTGFYYMAGHTRLHYVIVLGAVFFLLMLLFARGKGFNSVLSLIFICAAIFLVFVPAILSGGNIYLVTIIICLYAILSTLLMVIGANKKALASILGCTGGVLLAGLLMFAMDRITKLTGFIDEETMWLTLLDNPIDIRAIIFAGVLIGALGAIMDVAMSISSSLWELRKAGGVSDFKSIFASGMNIGKDIMGTMLNTLILAYIGSSLSLILLIVAHSTSFQLLFSMELIIVELLRALVGSFGMLLAIPLTAAICAWLFIDTDADEYALHFDDDTGTDFYDD